MKYKSEILKAPEKTKFDLIEDKQKYLDQMLKDRRDKYDSERNAAPSCEQSEGKKKLRFVLYVAALVLFVVGAVLKYTVKPDYIGYILVGVACLLGMAGLCLSPKREYYKPINPYRLKLIKPVEMEALEERSRKKVSYSLFFDYTDESGELNSALAEINYSEEEKQKICNSFSSGNLVVAISLDDDTKAVIIEY